MKKGVLGACIVFFLVLIVPVSYALLGSETIWDEESVTYAASLDAPAEVASGYWTAEDERIPESNIPLAADWTDDTSYGTLYYQSDILGNLLTRVVPGQVIDGVPGSVYSQVDITSGTIESRKEVWTKNLENLYHDLGVDYGPAALLHHQIHTLRFVLYPDLYSRDEGPTYGMILPDLYPADHDNYDDFVPYGSHGSLYQGGTVESYTDPCIYCESIDEIGTCYPPPMPADATCVRMNILNREDCSEMADYEAPFCEGVAGIPISQETDALVTPDNVHELSVPGPGGCRIGEFSDAGVMYAYVAQEGTPMRDWFYLDVGPDEDFYLDYGSSSKLPKNGPSSRGFSPDYHGNEDIIGRCCGNDPQDYGALASVDGDDWRNAVACVFAQGNWIWALSDDIDHQFRIYNHTRPVIYRPTPSSSPVTENVTFDIISNTENFFVCGTHPGVANLYDHESAAGGRGPRVDAYETLPPRERSAAAGMTRDTGATVGEGTGPYNTAEDCEGDDCGGSRNDLIGEDDFQDSIRDIEEGAAVQDRCDKDGDGYDGNWVAQGGDPTWEEWTGATYEGFTSIWESGQSYDPWTDSELDPGDCIPQPPFDCDDTDNTINWAAPDYCDDAVDSDCDPSVECMERETPEIDASTLEPIYDDMIGRIMCHDTDGTGAFAECCAWDLEYCWNEGRGRREGSAINTLLEFTNENYKSSNAVLRYGIAKPTTAPEDIPEDDYYYLVISEEEFDEQNIVWSKDKYKSLEFDIYLTKNFELELWLGTLKDPDRRGRMGGEPDPDDYTFPFKARIEDYIVGEPRLKTWVHVVIPIDDIYAGLEYPVHAFAFAANKRRVRILDDTAEAVQPIGGLTEFSNIVGVDKVMLRPSDSALLEPNHENYYCSGTWPPLWIDDLDDIEPASSYDPEWAALITEPVGKAACNAIPSYTWTGNYCCGDDNGEDVGEGIKGALSFKEFFADEVGACWAGRFLASEERVMLLQFSMSDFRSGRPDPWGMSVYNVTCSDDECIYALPPREGVIVTNDHADTYDLSFVQLGMDPVDVGSGAVSPSSASRLKASSIPLQVLYHDQDFYTCEGEDYLFELKSTVGTRELLIDPDNDMARCEPMGNYICDHPLGKDRGWVDEPVYAYRGAGTDTEVCLDTDEAIPGCDNCPDFNADFVCDCPDVDEDGTCDDCIDEEEPFLVCDDAVTVASEEGLVPATSRTLDTPGYNLIMNGGFENV